MAEVQMIRTPGGDELVVLDRAQYEALMRDAAGGAPQPEDVAEANAVGRVATRELGRIARGEDVAIPIEVWDAIEAKGGSPVRELRKWRRLTQAALGEKIGRDQTFIAKLEAGRVELTLSTALALATALGVPVEALEGWPVMGSPAG